MNSKKILLVDDEVDYTEILSLSLEQFGGYSVRTENNASKVAQVADEFKPDLILLDIMMPEMDGGEVAALLAEKQSTRAIPVVFLSAIVVPADTAQSAKTPLRHYLSKTTPIEKLIEKIKTILGNDTPSAVDAPQSE